MGGKLEPYIEAIVGRVERGESTAGDAHDLRLYLDILESTRATARDLADLVDRQRAEIDQLRRRIAEPEATNAT